MQISVSKIKLNPRNRKNEQLTVIESVKDKGVITPIVVRKDGDGYIVVAGNRRLYSAQKFGLKTIDCKIVAGDFSTIQGLENMERKPLREIDKSEIYASMLREGNTIAQIAKWEDCSRVRVGRICNLQYLIPELKEKMKDGVISFDAGLELAVLNAAKQQESLELFKDERVPSWWEISRFCSESYPKLNDIAPGFLEYAGCSSKSCKECDYKSLKQADLFEAEENLCLNLECFKMKLESFAQAQHLKIEPDGYEEVYTDTKTALKGLSADGEIKYYKPIKENNSKKETLNERWNNDWYGKKSFGDECIQFLSTRIELPKSLIIQQIVKAAKENLKFAGYGIDVEKSNDSVTLLLFIFKSRSSEIYNLFKFCGREETPKLPVFPKVIEEFASEMNIDISVLRDDFESMLTDVKSWLIVNKKELENG